jgi:hypothetical protein
MPAKANINAPRRKNSVALMNHNLHKVGKMSVDVASGADSKPTFTEDLDSPIAAPPIYRSTPIDRTS